MAISQRHFLKRHALAAALSLCFAGGLHAQSNITGSIYGNADAGSTIVVENKDTGLVRRISVDAAGRYQVSALPNGHYKVTQEKNGTAVSTRDNIAVNIASGTEVSFANATANSGAELGTVTVVGTSSALIDVSQTDTRTVLSAEQLNKISVARDISSVAMLAPSVVFSDSYKAVNGITIPSFGGSASSENAYFINGYNVTNPFNSLGYTALPFDSIGQQQVLTGGYGAEFGRSTGGVINIVSKRGSNAWKGGVYTQWAPKAGRAAPRDYFYANTGYWNAANHPFTTNTALYTDGTLYQYRKDDTFWTTTVGGYVSGPIIRNALFLYANVETTREQGNLVNTNISQAASAQRNGWRQYQNDYPRGLVKLDWNLNANHSLEFTGVVDDAKVAADFKPYDYTTLTHSTVVNRSSVARDRSRLYIGKYTGNLSDNLVLTALYGTQKVTHDLEWSNYRADCPSIVLNSGANPAAIPVANFSGGCQVWNATGGSQVPGERLTDKTRGGRIDLAWRVGSHDLRFGYERQDAQSDYHINVPGGYAWLYAKVANGNTDIGTATGVKGPNSAPVPGPYAAGGYYVQRIRSEMLANLRTVQASQYIEDRWQIGDHLLLSLGLRNEQFANYDSSGAKYISLNRQLAPRLGAVWDVMGDSRLKLFANAGRYHLAVPSSAARRSQATITNQYYTYTGVNPDGTPIYDPVANAIKVDPGKFAVCQGTTNVVSSNLECGTPMDPRTESATNIKSHFQDEFILGFEAAVTDRVNMGAKITHRILRSAIDDVCDPSINFGRCTNFNPGVDNTFISQKRDGTFETVTLPASAFPKLKRGYSALDLFVEHGFSNRWYGKLAYTYSKNRGNTEGQLSSELDAGAGGQTDVGRTQDWDKPGLMENAYGYLPNDRRHQLKAFGYVQLSDDWRVGTTMIWASGRPRSCLSYNPNPNAVTYASSTNFYCGLTALGNATPAPRGTYGTTPNSFLWNLNVAYVPSWAGKHLTLQADVINVLNKQTPGLYYPRYAQSTATVNPLYQREMQYSAPRYFRLTARYDF